MTERKHVRTAGGNVVRGVTVDEYNAMVAATMREEVLQARVEELLRTFGWVWFHDQDSRRNRAGLPDLIAARRGRLLFAELKAQNGRMRADQLKWQAELELVAETVATEYGPHPEPVQYHVWRPIDLVEGRIEEALR